MLLYLYLFKSLLYQPLGTQTCPNILPQFFLALFQKELSLLSSPQLIFIDIDPLFLPYLSQIFFCSLKKKKALQSYPIKKIRRNFHRLDEPPFDTHSHGSSEGARIVRLWRWPSRCFDHGDPPSVAHITKPVVPLSRVYNPLYNTFHRDNPQLLPLGFKSAVSISPTAVSRGAR